MKIKIFLLILLSAIIVPGASAQKPNKKIVVTGTVTDAQNKPIYGALVMLDGKNTNVSTNNKGNYKVRVRPDADSITIITFNNGVKSQAINSRTNINFILGPSGLSSKVPQDYSRNEESVNIGYGNVKQKNLLNNVSTIDARSGKYATYKNIYEILKGTPGVMVNGNSIKIQGQSSFNAGTEPLFVVDGMTVQSVDDISPSMVESISVLKGASTSIYGARGANGVILITLIKGSGMK
jgi:TonB-dependent starch-binding outer membrane protein SusC